MSEPEPGSYPRVNGGMIQSDQYDGMIVSIVGKFIGPETLQAADGTNIVLNTDSIAEALSVNPDLCIEVIGSVANSTTVTAFISRDLSTDMDLELYNKMIQLQKSPKYSSYFQK